MHCVEEHDLSRLESPAHIIPCDPPWKSAWNHELSRTMVGRRYKSRCKRVDFNNVNQRDKTSRLHFSWFCSKPRNSQQHGVAKNGGSAGTSRSAHERPTFSSSRRRSTIASFQQWVHSFCLTVSHLFPLLSLLFCFGYLIFYFFCLISFLFLFHCDLAIVWFFFFFKEW